MSIKVGDKLRQDHWDKGNHLIVKAIADDEFWGEIHPKSCWAVSPVRATYGLNADWVPYVEPPTVVEVRNVWKDSISAVRHRNRVSADIDAEDSYERVAVITLMSDGEVIVDDLR